MYDHLKRMQNNDEMYVLLDSFSRKPKSSCRQLKEGAVVKNFIKDLSNLKDAFRVLEIMDKCTCDIEKITRDGLEKYDYWIIKPKKYVSENDAKDLQTIILFKRHYSRERSVFKGYEFPRVLM